MRVSATMLLAIPLDWSQIRVEGDVSTVVAPVVLRCRVSRAMRISRLCELTLAFVSCTTLAAFGQHCPRTSATGIGTASEVRSGFVLYGYCGKDFVVDEVFGTPEANPSHFTEGGSPDDAAAFNPESAAAAGKKELNLGYTCVRKP